MHNTLLAEASAGADTPFLNNPTLRTSIYIAIFVSRDGQHMVIQAQNLCCRSQKKTQTLSCLHFLTSLRLPASDISGFFDIDIATNFLAWCFSFS